MHMTKPSTDDNTCCRLTVNCPRSPTKPGAVFRSGHVFATPVMQWETRVTATVQKTPDKRQGHNSVSLKQPMVMLRYLTKCS